MLNISITAKNSINLKEDLQVGKMVGRDLLEAIVKLVPFMKELYPQDIVMGVVDTEKYLIYERGATFDLGIKTGDPVKPGSAVHKAMTQKERIITTLSKDVWGVPVKGIAIPVFDEADSVIGAIAVILSMENQDRLQEVIEQFTLAFEHVNSSVQDISTGSQNLARIGANLADTTHNTKDNIRKTDEIIQLIREIASQTRMLGLNAAIEAARAGEHGRGFSVVAEEIRRLSEQSNNSARQVKEILDIIVDSISSIGSLTEETSAVSEEQSAATQEIAASMEELSAQLTTLGDFAKLV